MSQEWILGLNAYHADAAACLVRGGEVVVAIEEERLSRVKHATGLPVRAVAACLETVGIELGQVTHMAVNRNPRARLLDKLRYTVTRWPDPRLVLARLRNAHAWAGVAEGLASAFPDQTLRAQFHPVEHHLAHLASAFYPSPFPEALAVSLDGFGDFASVAWGVGRGAHLAIAGRIPFPHSLGLFYQAITQYLGFYAYGDEYKVMGLAALGREDPELTRLLSRLVYPSGHGRFKLALGYFRHHRDPVAYRWDGGAPQIGQLFSAKLESLLGPARLASAPLEPRHADIARAAQQVFEDRAYALLEALRKESGQTRLALAGGCAQNSLANGRLAEASGFDHVWMPPAANDSGGAVGAALAVWHRLSGGKRSPPMNHAFLGPKPTLEAMETALAAHAATLRIGRIEDRDTLAKAAATRLAEGAVVGLFDGPMEWGPRALGARSILADPRRADTRERLNAAVKLRESFRPFAPAVLAEQIPDWFGPAHADAFDSPFMSKVVPVRAERRALVPAITHEDGTARLQSLARDHATLLRPIIEHFLALTEVPMVVNTSFNENEPLVATPVEAVDCFLRTGMDALIMPPFLVERA